MLSSAGMYLLQSFISDRPGPNSRPRSALRAPNLATSQRLAKEQMSLTEGLTATEEPAAPAEIIIPDYGAPPAAADKGPTAIGSEAPPAGTQASVGSLEGCCTVDPLPTIITVQADSTITDAALAQESALRQTNLYNITAYRACRPARLDRSHV